MIETRRTCVVSAAHLKPETWDALFAMPLADWPVMGAPLGPDMLMVYAHTETDREMEAFPDLCDVIRWARAQIVEGANPPHDPGFEYVILDREVDPDEDGTNLPDLSDQEPQRSKPGDTYLERFPPEARPHCERAYQDGFEDGASEVSKAEEQRDELNRILRDLFGEAKALDDQMSGDEDGNGSRPPTGDDYNTLDAMIGSAELMRTKVMGERS